LKRQPLWRISVTATPEAEDAVGAFMENYFGETPSTYTDSETGNTTVTIYCQTKPDWNPATRLEIAGALRRIARCGVEFGQPTISLAKLKPQDWAESWKRHFKPLEIGSRLLIKPSWSRHKPRKGQALVVLDPGLSFGTGQHPTTAFCLEQLAVRRQPGRQQSFLDIGTGSGILAIAAAKMGYRPVHAFDFDPESIRIARGNARRNRESRKIQFLHQDVRKLPARTSKKYSVICANLISTLLVAERNRILTHLEAEGILIVAGILKNEFDTVREAYEGPGLRLMTSRTEKEWRSASFWSGNET